MDKVLEKIWEIAAKAITEQAWLAVPLVVFAIFVHRLPSLVKEYLAHRRAMWELITQERRRRENVERRQKRAAEKRTKDK